MKGKIGLQNTKKEGGRANSRVPAAWTTALAE